MLIKVHRIGRTGRAGAKGIAISFLNEEEDSKIVKDLLKFMEESGAEISEDLLNLRGAYSIIIILILIRNLKNDQKIKCKLL